MATYEVTTDSGSVYQIETADSKEATKKESGKVSKLPGAFGLAEAAINKDISLKDQFGEMNRQATQVTLGLIEGATGGLLRQGIKKATGLEIPRGEGVYAAVGQIGGTFIGAPSIAAKGALAGVRGLTKGVPILGRLFTGGSLVQKGAQMGLEGAVGGALFTQEGDFNIDARLDNAKAGGLISAIAGPLGASAIKKLGGAKQMEQAKGTIKDLITQKREMVRDSSRKVLVKALEGYADDVENQLSSATAQAKANIAKMSLDDAVDFRNNWPKFERGARQELSKDFARVLNDAPDIPGSKVTDIMESWTDDLLNPENGFNLNPSVVDEVYSAASKLTGRATIKARELSNFKSEIQDIIKRGGKMTGSNSDRAIYDLATRITDVFSDVPGVAPVRDMYRSLSVGSKFANQLGVGQSTIKTGTVNLIEDIATGGTKGEELSRYRQLRTAMRMGPQAAMKEKALVQEFTNPTKLEKAAKELNDKIFDLTQEKAKIVDSMKSARESAAQALKNKRFQIDSEIIRNKELLTRLSSGKAGRFAREFGDIIFKGGTGFLLFKILNKLTPGD